MRSPALSTAPLRSSIAALIRALSDDELLALVGDRVHDLVARQAGADVPKVTEPRRPRRERRSAEAIGAITGRAKKQSASVPKADPGADPWLPWPRAADDGTPLGIDLAGLGPHGGPMAEEVRAVVAKVLKGGAARLLDLDDVAADVHRRILRRNHRPSAFDPRRASWSHYVFRVATCSIRDLLKPAKRVAAHELGGGNGTEGYDPDRDEVSADPHDPLAALELVDLAVKESGLDVEATVASGKATFRPAEKSDADYWLELTGEPLGPPREQLWQRALRQRQSEQARPRAEREQEAQTVEGAVKRVAPNRARFAALDAEILEYVRAETAAGRRVLMKELADMLGVSFAVVRGSFDHFRASGRVEMRGRGRGLRGGFWALPQAPVEEPAPPVVEIIPMTPPAVESVAAEEPREAEPSTTCMTQVVAPEPAAPVVESPPPVQPEPITAEPVKQPPQPAPATGRRRVGWYGCYFEPSLLAKVASRQ